MALAFDPCAVGHEAGSEFRHEVRQIRPPLLVTGLPVVEQGVEEPGMEVDFVARAAQGGEDVERVAAAGLVPFVQDLRFLQQPRRVFRRWNPAHALPRPCRHFRGKRWTIGIGSSTYCRIASCLNLLSRAKLAMCQRICGRCHCHMLALSGLLVPFHWASQLIWL